MVKAVDRPPVSPAVARAAIEATKDDALLHAAASLLLLAGLRSGEASTVRVRDWAPGDDPKLTVRGLRAEPGVRTIRVAATAAAAVDAYLAGEEAEPGEPLLLGLRPTGIPLFLPKLFRDAMRSASLDVTVHDLRRAAVAAVTEAGTPMTHIEAYFGISKTDAGRKNLVPVREGYDRDIAAALEAAFTV